jgi:hypothetical protein
MIPTGAAAPGMDHRITTAIVVCVGGTLGFTLLLALLSSSAPSGASASTPGSAAQSAGPTPATRLAAVVRQLDSAAYRFRRQHGGRDPDFSGPSPWDQFLQPTDARGQVVKAVLKAPAENGVGPSPRTFGPYLTGTPVNALNGRGDVVVTDDATEAGDRVPSGPVGFVYSPARGRFRGTDETGKALAATEPSP